ncbi:hypothetical protein EV361DRAFT_974071 [Lentinula raphanica]|uniref:F-box domain-containing protein n=1 Tax=Lentinula raphanica TaxID=153919 RepID=A0AA38P397_9AGAR|nr:hypothetical protein F5880DRAFT_1624718 [Lentinula raphanica]KAJ3835479.1 hypothetical protein F5878DRAFT_718782 [Lentinula raphanica]KAJ3965083.1 hypothetical protein EV361DRAFT_974071 [Lentinula raphanica]
MGTNLPISSDLAPYVYRSHRISDNTLDQAQLETRCPFDNGRHDCTSISARYTANQFDQLPLELLTEVLLQLDFPSLTRFRTVNRRTMELVNSIRQYTAIIEHRPNIIRAVVSVQADGFDCATLYKTLCTTRYCRRVCYLCFIYRPEYFPLTRREAYRLLAYRLFISNAKLQTKAESSRKRLDLTKLPSILSLPVVQHLASDGLPKFDKVAREPKRYMAIISAPISSGAHMNFESKYTTEEISRHFASFGPVVESSVPGRFMHATKD